MNVDTSLHDLLNLSIYTMADDEGDGMSDTTEAKVAEAAQATGTKGKTKKELIDLLIGCIGLAIGYSIAFSIACLKSLKFWGKSENQGVFVKSIRNAMGQDTVEETQAAEQKS